jgi:hypothetical protein
MRFEHDYGFHYSTNYSDGGLLEYSLNGGPWEDASAKFSAGHNYNGTLSSTNPLGERKAFMKWTMNYTQSRYDLSTLGGNDIKFRFHVGTAGQVKDYGWYIDNVKIYTCIGVPAIPALQTPAANSLVTDYTPSLNWNDATLDLDHYQIQVDDNNDFSSTVFDDDTLTASQYDVPSNLDPDKTYDWRVRSFNFNDDTKGWTAGRAFRTALLPPNLVSPSGVINTDRPTFDWDAVTNATGYGLQVSKNSGFTLLAGTYSITSGSTTEYTPTADLPGDTDLWWRAQTKGSNGPSDWSSAVSFHTANPPSVPVLVSPTNNALTTDYTPYLDWGKSTVPAGTTFNSYNLHISTDPAFATTDIDVSIADVDEHYYTIPDLNTLYPDTKYYWRVMAFETTGDNSAWSLVRTFRTALPPPGGLSPCGGDLTRNRPDFDWGDVTNASGYNLQVSRNPAFTLLALNATITGGTHSYYTPTADLPANINVWWRVRANGTPNGPGAWSASCGLDTANPPSIPTLVSPANNALLTDYTPLLDWNIVTVPAGTSFQGYCQQVADTSDFSSLVYNGCNGGDINAHQYEIPTLTANTKYWWRVKSYNTDGEYSSWSLVRYFRTTLTPPTLSSPGNGSSTSDTTPTFDWGDVTETGASGYTIQVSRNSAFTLLAKSASVVGGTNSTYTPTTVLPTGITLWWHVKTNGTPNGPGGYSDPWTFCIDPLCP